MKASSLQGVPDRSDLPKTTRLCTWKEGRRATVRLYTVYRKITFSFSNMEDMQERRVWHETFSYTIILTSYIFHSVC